MKSLKNLGKREKALLGVVAFGILGIGGLLLFGGGSQNASVPQAMPTVQAPPIQEPPPLPKEQEREQEKPQVQVQTEDKSVDLLFLEYAKKSQKETQQSSQPLPNLPQLPPIPPFREEKPMPIPLGEKITSTPETIPITIYGITCQETCKAITNLGVLKAGDRIGDERVLAIDKTGIRTNKRFIAF